MEFSNGPLSEICEIARHIWRIRTIKCFFRYPARRVSLLFREPYFNESSFRATEDHSA